MTQSSGGLPMPQLQRLAACAADLDANATSPLDGRARQAMIDAIAADAGNPSSVHGRGQAGRLIVEQARHRLAAAIGAAANEVVFTSGATEANTLAWRGVLHAALAKGVRPVVLTTAVEHPSIAAIAKQMTQLGAEIRWLPVDGCGRWRLDQAEALIAGGPLHLVSAIWVNNETGVIHPISQLANLARNFGATVHCDATQAPGRIAVDVGALGVDLVSLSGHKFGAPKGVGALWVRAGVALQAVQPGHQEHGLRAGTENVIGLAGLGGAALTIAERLAQMPAVRQRRDRLLRQLLAIAGAERHAAVEATEETGHVINIGFAGCDAAQLVMALDLDGVLASAGSACASGTLEPSHVQLAMHGHDAAGRAKAARAVRLSLGPHVDDAAVAVAAERIAAAVARLRAAGADG